MVFALILGVVALIYGFVRLVSKPLGGAGPRFYNLQEKQPSPGTPVWVKFKDKRRPIKCRLNDNYEHPEWILPNGEMKGLVFTEGWRHCTDQDPQA